MERNIKLRDNTKLIFDFDGTFTSVEALDELAEIILEEENDEKKKRYVISSIKKITNQGMNGEITFRESLEKRFSILDINKDNLDKLIDVLRKNISLSINNNKKFFEENSSEIIIISGGFKEFIVPIVKDFGIDKDAVFANTFVFDDDKVVGFDKDNPLSKSGGKIDVVKEIGFDLNKYSVIMIGDGYTDFEVKKEGAASKFFAYTENYYRESVAKEADGIISHLEELFEYI